MTHISEMHISDMLYNSSARLQTTFELDFESSGHFKKSLKVFGSTFEIFRCFGSTSKNLGRRRVSFGKN